MHRVRQRPWRDGYATGVAAVVSTIFVTEGGRRTHVLRRINVTSHWITRQFVFVTNDDAVPRAVVELSFVDLTEEDGLEAVFEGVVAELVRDVRTAPYGSVCVDLHNDVGSPEGDERSRPGPAAGLVEVVGRVRIKVGSRSSVSV